MSGFQLGIAIGPAIGGLMIDNWGIPITYVLCGGLFLGITGLNHLYLNETLLNTDSQKKKATEPLSKSFTKSIQEASKSWKQIVKKGEIMDPVLLNAAYWFALSGVQMTTLPLLMVSPVFTLTASQIGQSFALMSVCSVITSQPVAILADKVGKISTMFGGCSLIASSILTLPYASTYPELLLTLVPLAIGSTILQSVPTSLLADLATNSEERAQGQSLLRTSGDIGLVLGAVFSGSLLQFTTIDTVLNTDGIVLTSAMTYFAVRYLTRNKIIK
jgi:MFS family permease